MHGLDGTGWATIKLGLVLHDRYLGRIYGTSYIPFKLATDNNSGGSNEKTVLVLRETCIPRERLMISSRAEGRRTWTSWRRTCVAHARSKHHGMTSTTHPVMTTTTGSKGYTRAYWSTNKLTQDSTSFYTARLAGAVDGTTAASYLSFSSVGVFPDLFSSQRWEGVERN